MEERQSLDLLNYRAGLESALPEQVTNSDVFVTLDTGVLIFDIKGKRVQITDFVMDLTEAEIKSLLAPLPKFYFSSDTHRAFRYVNDTCYALDGRDDFYTKKEIEDKLIGKSNTSHKHDDLYAALVHDHDDSYHTKQEMTELLAGKSGTFHTHDGRYYTEEEIDVFLGNKSDTAHNHDDLYAAVDHNHDLVYQTIDGMSSLLNEKADVNHDHANVYAPSDHNHDERYYTEDEIDVFLGDKSDKTHNHDDLYAALVHDHDDSYHTKQEMEELLAGKSETSHTHDSRYYTKAEVDTKISTAFDEFDGDFGEELDDETT